MAYVSGALRAQGVEVAGIDLQYIPPERQESALRAEFWRRRPEVVAISSLSQGFGRTREVVRAMRALDPAFPS